MKLLLHLICEWLYDKIIILKKIKQPKHPPSLLAYNVTWFTACTWVDQLIAFKQIDNYLTYRL